MSLGNETTFSMPVVPAYTTGGNCGGGMWGGDWSSWIILFLIFGMFNGGWGGGFGGWGGGGAGLQGMATRADINEGFALNDIQNGIRGIQQGQCDTTYALNNSIMGGFHGVDNAICTLGYQNQQAISGLSAQLAQCCCDTRGAINEVGTGVERAGWNLSKQISDCCCDMEKMNMQSRFDAQTYNCNTLQAIDKLGDRIIDYMAAERTQNLRDENQALRMAANLSNQNAVFGARIDAAVAELLRRTGNDCPTAAYLVQPPTPVNFPTNGCGQVQFGGGWGCGCGSCA